jgi:transmembrane protein EpsG
LNVYYVAIPLSVLLAAWAGGTRRRADPPARPGGDLTASRLLAALLACASGLVLVAVGALRWRVGTDYWTYAATFPSFMATRWSDLGLLDEPGLTAIAKVGAQVRYDYAMMFAIAAAVTIGLTVRTIYTSSSAFALSILLYALIGSWQGSFNGVRQYLACAVIFAAHRFVIERRLAAYVFAIALAALFHLSALAMLSLYLVPRTRLGLVRGLLLLLGAVASLHAYSYFFELVEAIKEPTLSVAESSYAMESVNPLRVLLAFVPVVFFLAFTEKATLSPRDYFYCNMVIVNAAVALAGSGSAYISRFSIYTSIFLVLAIPAMLNMRDRRERALGSLGFIATYSVFWFLETTQTAALANFHWVFDRP